MSWIALVTGEQMSGYWPEGDLGDDCDGDIAGYDGPIRPPISPETEIARLARGLLREANRPDREGDRVRVQHVRFEHHARRRSIGTEPRWIVCAYVGEGFLDLRVGCHRWRLHLT
jgi:hypothetical protein